MSASAFTLLWANDYCKRLKKAGDEGRELRVLFGGSHQSQPSLTKYGVGPGDYVYPIRVQRGALFVISRLCVERFVSVGQYLAQTLAPPEEYRRLHVWELSDRLWADHPELGHLIPWGCLVEVALGSEGFPMRFDRAVPPEIVQELRYISTRGERAIKHLDGGLIKSCVSLQGGVYRLSNASAALLERVLVDSMHSG